MHIVSFLHPWTSNHGSKTVQVFIKKNCASVDPCSSNLCCSRVNCKFGKSDITNLKIFFKVQFKFIKLKCCKSFYILIIHKQTASNSSEDTSFCSWYILTPPHSAFSKIGDEVFYNKTMPLVFINTTNKLAKNKSTNIFLISGP